MLLSRIPSESSLEEGRARAELGASVITNRDEKRRAIEELGKRALPPYPGTSTIPEIVVKPPALIDPSRSRLDQARMLAKAYRETCHYKCGLKSSFFQFGRLDANPYFASLVRAAEKLSFHKIPPLAWCLFSFDVWADKVTPNGKPPPVTWAYGVTRILSRLTWFESRRADYVAPRIRLAPKHIELLRDWETMWHSLLANPPTSRNALLAAIDEVFPGESFEKRVSAARYEARTMQAAIDQTVAEGGGLWQAS